MNTVFPNSEESITKPLNITPATLKFKLTRETVHTILDIIPNTPEYEYVRALMNRLLRKIEYTAPEILGVIWSEMHKVLQNYIKRSENSPEWMERINNVWIKSLDTWSNLNKEFMVIDK